MPARTYLDPLTRHLPMITRYSVFDEGQEYVLLCKAQEIAAQSWTWVYGRSLDRVSLADVERLLDIFLRKTQDLGRQPHRENFKGSTRCSARWGQPENLILRWLGAHVPRKCVDCRKLTTDGYPGPRCESCHEQFVRTGRLRNGTYNNVSRKSHGARHDGVKRATSRLVA